MNDYQRLIKVQNEQNFRSMRDFALNLGINPQNFYDIKAERCGISEAIAMKIHEKFQDYSVAWLMGLDGNTVEMQEGDTELSMLIRAVAKSQEQIDRLISLKEMKEGKPKEKTA